MIKIETYEEAVDFYGPDAWLSSLAEECSELSKACLKLIRARDSVKNYNESRPVALYTPVTVDNATADLEEEILDVMAAIQNVTHFFPLAGIGEDKDTRLVNRLNEKLGFTK